MRLRQDIRFNPTMVRLLPSSQQCGCIPQVAFQSHNGAIAARYVIHEAVYVVKVSIPQWCDCCTRFLQSASLVHSRFNPTMVRLLPLPSGVYISRQASFQSHNGAIAAHQNFVRISSMYLVSIPQWCDCCSVKFDCCRDRVYVSIPQWCDCCPYKVGNTKRDKIVSIPQWCDCC